MSDKNGNVELVDGQKCFDPLIQSMVKNVTWCSSFDKFDPAYLESMIYTKNDFHGAADVINNYKSLNFVDLSLNDTHVAPDLLTTGEVLPPLECFDPMVDLEFNACIVKPTPVYTEVIPPPTIESDFGINHNSSGIENGSYVKRPKGRPKKQKRYRM